MYESMGVSTRTAYVATVLHYVEIEVAVNNSATLFWYPQAKVPLSKAPDVMLVYHTRVAVCSTSSEW